MKKIFFLAISALFLSSICHSEIPTTYLLAKFSAGNYEMEANEYAIEDDVTFRSNGEFFGTLDLGVRQHFTVSANSFQNICAIKVTADNDYLDYLKPEDVKLTIISASGDGIESLQDLKSNLTQSFAQDQTCRFVFGTGVRIAEITVETNVFVSISEVGAFLDVIPDVPAGTVNVSADDIVPFTKKSNHVSYRYCVSDDTDNIIEDSSELEGEFKPVPDEGITLSGKSDGNYVVYVDTPDNFVNPLKHINVSYVANPATSLIDGPGNVLTEEYFDLMGRQVKKGVRGLHIVRQGDKSKIMVR